MIKFKSLFTIIFAMLFLSGCATYSFRKGESPYNNGFVAARYDRVLPEYTLGKDNSVPDEKTAKERFQRRRKQVESYYKKMGYIENRFKEMFIDPPVLIFQTTIGIFRMPAIAIRDYKYNHDALYKAEVEKKEDAAYKAEKERLKALKDELNSYIQKDLEKNESTVSTPSVVAEKVEPPPKTKEVVKNEIATSPAAPRNDLLIAVITAKPLKGLSPLTVQFSAAKSSSPNGRIVFYSWDFGDGDSSTKKNTSNTYWSTTYGSRKFIATLTIKDNKGISTSSATEIEVITK